MLSSCRSYDSMRHSLVSILRRLMVVGFISIYPGAHGMKSGGRDTRGLGELNLDLRGMLGGGSLLNYFRGRQPTKGVWAEIRASSANAPTPSGADEGNILSVAVWARDYAISMIKLSLPERQQCYQGDTGACTGYMFNQGPSGSCDIIPWPENRKLPTSHDGLKVIDLYKTGLLGDCDFNNTVGDYSTKLQKRSSLRISIKQDNQYLIKNKFLVFLVRVRNPPTTPVSRENSRFTSNTYWVTVRSKFGKIGDLVLAAPKILSVWHCSYTEISWTSACTAKCGGGVSYGVRRLLHPPPMQYPAELLVRCDFPLSVTRPCNIEPCDVDCKLGEWIPFADGPCSVTCGEGFMVERRRIIEGPVGNGAPCPDWNELDVRVKFSPCRGKEKTCDARCDPTDEKTSMDATLYGACSDICHTVKEPEGRRSVIRVAERKAPSATGETCGFAPKEQPCGVPCKYINFFPGGGRLPRLGKWADIVLVLYLSVRTAEDLFLLAPPGFEIARQDTTNHCLLKSHNLPRLKACIVDTADDGRMRATFQLLNPLETKYTDASGKVYHPEFEIRFWAKSPSGCDGGFDENGACKDSSKWIWHFFFNDEALSEFGSLDAEEVLTVQRGDNQAAYNVYGEAGRETDWELIQLQMKKSEADEERNWEKDLEAIQTLNKQF